MESIRECLIQGEGTESVSIRLPKSVYVLLRDVAQREGDFRNITGIVKRGLYTYLFTEFMEEATNTLATEGYPLNKTGTERERWLSEKEMVFSECKAVKEFLTNLIEEIEAEEKRYAKTLDTIRAEGHEKYRQALKIIQRVEDGRVDRKEADREIKKILGWGLEEHEKRLGLR